MLKRFEFKRLFMLLAAAITITVFTFADQFHTHPADFDLHEDCPVLVLNLFAKPVPLLFFLALFLPVIDKPLLRTEPSVCFAPVLIFKKLYSRRAPPASFLLQ